MRPFEAVTEVRLIGAHDHAAEVEHRAQALGGVDELCGARQPSNGRGAGGSGDHTAHLGVHSAAEPSDGLGVGAGDEEAMHLGGMTADP